jgi:hypothetical protein
MEDVTSMAKETFVMSRLSRPVKTLAIAIMTTTVLLLSGIISPHTLPVARAAYGYQCNGQPFNSVTSDNVCHALGITRPGTPYGLTATFNTANIVCTNCSIPGYYSNEIKIADDNADWVELGFMNGWYGQCGGAGTSISNDCYQTTGLYWSDSRPQIDQGWNFHYICPLTNCHGPDANGNDTSYNVSGQTLQFRIYQDNHEIRPVHRYDNQWDIYIDDVNGGYTYCYGGCGLYGSTGGSTSNTMVATQVQIGSMLSGLYGLDADPVTFKNRGYSQSTDDAATMSGNIGTNYQEFDDSPLSWQSLSGGDYTISCQGCAYRTYSSTTSQQKTAVNKSSVVSTSDGVTGPGIPAIKVDSISTSSITGSQVVSNNVNMLRVSGNAVTNFARTTGIPFSRGQQHPTVTSTQLLTSEQISAILHGESTGFPANKQLWFVQMTGSFAYAQQANRHHAYEIIDPSTGNLVMMGASK